MKVHFFKTLRLGGDTRVSSPTSSDFQGMACTTQKEIERDTCSDSCQKKSKQSQDPMLT